ncbi:MAG TPA: cobalamin-independent methionine synthase II family protein [Dehalococcoidia bacterium]|nr:cobalamin-independent methionine synthase II family protein [Dehalococcoidia bacterium]
MADSIRADQVGSLLRPPELLEARIAHAEGRLGDEQLREREDAAILQALELQRQTGMPIFTDGEYRRAMWLTGLPAAVEGFVAGRIPLIGDWRDLKTGEIDRPQLSASSRATGWAIGGRLRARGRFTGVESAFLKQHAPGPYKITMPSPTWFLRSYQRGLSDAAYPTAEDALGDLVAIVRSEVQALVAEGVPYIQLDSIRYVFDFADETHRREWQEAGVDPDAAVAQNVSADNAVIAGQQRDGVTFALHMCRGNNRSHWFAQGSYDRIAAAVFPHLNFDRLLLEYDSARAGGFEPLRFVPRGKTVVLGLISTKTPELERQDDLIRRIDEATKYVPLESLALGPQCGFASVSEGNLLTWDEQRRKLDLLVETARRVWGQGR